MNISNKWRDNACSVKEKLNYILTNEKTQQDVVIVTGCGSTETKIEAHSFMLFLGSEVLENLLEQAKMSNEGMRELKMPDVNPETMKFVLKYIYTDSFNVESEDPIDILNASIKLEMCNLSGLCIAKLKDELTATNVLRIFEESVKMNVEEMVQYSQQFILKNAREVFSQEQFLNITNESLCKLLIFDELEIEEVPIFNSIISWAKAECKRSELKDTSKNLRFVLKNIVPLIRFTLMPIHEFASVVFPTKILDSQEVNDVFVHLAMQSSGKKTEPPAWILSSSERIITFESKNVSLTSFDRCAANLPENKGQLQIQTQPKNTVKDKLLQYLKNISGKSTIPGLFFQRTGIDCNRGIKIIHEITGVHPGILTLTMPSCKDGMDKWQSFTEEIISKWNNGYLVQIVWWSDEHPLAQSEIDAACDDKKWNELISENGHLNQKWKKQLDSIIPYFQQLQDAGVVVICDFLPWINYEGYAWGGRLEMHGGTKLYQITHDYMTQKHRLHSLLWTWSFDISGDTSKLADFWPGYNYVDVVSAYIWDTKEMDKELYLNLLLIAGDKPMSMEYLHNTSLSLILLFQPRWSWFTTPVHLLEPASFTYSSSIKTTYKNRCIIKKENNEFFTTLNSN